MRTALLLMGTLGILAVTVGAFILWGASSAAENCEGSGSFVCNDVVGTAAPFVALFGAAALALVLAWIGGNGKQ